MIAWTPRLAQSQDETEAVSTPPRRNVLSANPRFEMSFLPSLILSFLLVLHSLIVCVCVYICYPKSVWRGHGTTGGHHCFAPWGSLWSNGSKLHSAHWTLSLALL